MIVITGGAGFIGSQLLRRLNQEDLFDILVVDNLAHSSKWQNLLGKKFSYYLHKDQFLKKIKTDGLAYKITAIFHLGACSSTTEKDVDYLIENNVSYSQSLFKFCQQQSIPFVYASSAAVYGLGDKGYSDNHEAHESFRPLNPYGFSKHLFDSWVLKQNMAPPFWCGLRFFNVYGKGEGHKGFMQSVVTKAISQIQEVGTLKLFKSYHQNYKDGEQKRDFVYVKDIVNAMFALWKLGEKHLEQNISGLYNLGCGEARSFYDLANYVFSGLGKKVCIEWIDMPEELKAQYQYYTKAPMEKIKRIDQLDLSFHSLEQGIYDYLKDLKK